MVLPEGGQIMYCRKCGRYINGVKAKIRHQQINHCTGLRHFFDYGRHA